MSRGQRSIALAEVTPETVKDLPSFIRTVGFMEKKQHFNVYFHEVIPITVIKYPAQSYVCVQSTSKIDEDIVITDIQNCRYFIATSRQFCTVFFINQSGHIQAPEGQG